MDTESKNKRIAAVIFKIVALAALAASVLFYLVKPKGFTFSQPSKNFPSTVVVPINTADTIPGKKYKDGTYSAIGLYQTPESEESLSVSIALKKDIITDATVTVQAQAPESRRFQSQFIGNFKQYVIGRNIDTVVLDTVAGSSLTPKGFNDAVNQIKAQASRS